MILKAYTTSATHNGSVVFANTHECNGGKYIISPNERLPRPTDVESGEEEEGTERKTKQRCNKYLETVIVRIDRGAMDQRGHS